MCDWWGIGRGLVLALLGELAGLRREKGRGLPIIERLVTSLAFWASGSIVVGFVDSCGGDIVWNFRGIRGCGKLQCHVLGW
jgi:hypothetical protein